eukprot:CAMPEP_0179144388 /NCGR_PEP_ID=MMETSP0796-20121207/69553_1 /TAXON_ID=73915 /ORGANISM="Pyrodinium bahamense, Strain pbaha01" /LENGTH=34 /DNA_ID= /DNA_START= /DNA_END= /DNA_ORIENTATION=
MPAAKGAGIDAGIDARQENDGGANLPHAGEPAEA